MTSCDGLGGFWDRRIEVELLDETAEGREDIAEEGVIEHRSSPCSESVTNVMLSVLFTKLYKMFLQEHIVKAIVGILLCHDR